MTMTWSKIINEMASDYIRTKMEKDPRFLSRKGESLLTIASLCETAENNIGREFTPGDVQYTRDHDDKMGIIGYIPDCYEYGTDFCGEEMIRRLTGLHASYDQLCIALTTHDLHSFKIPHLGNLITAIRMSEGD